MNADNCPDFSLSKIEAREFVGNDDAVEIGRSRCQDGMTQRAITVLNDKRSYLP